MPESQAIESAEIVKKARDRWANGIHTCHDHCTRERCVERRKIKAMREALEAADECLALIEDVGHGAHMDNVTVARGIVARAILDSPNDKAMASPPLTTKNDEQSRD